MQLDKSAAPVRPASIAATNEIVALGTVALTTIMLIAVVSILFFLREILIPLSLAILLSFVLAPVVRFLQHWRVPRSAAAIAVVLASFAVISLLATIMAAGVRDLAVELPRYEVVLRTKIQTLRGMTAGSHTLDQAASILQSLNSELQTGDKNAGVQTAPGAPRQPVPVEIRQPDPGPIGTLSTLIAPLLNPLATTGVIIVFVIFILIQREDLRDRLIRLTGTRDLGRTTAAIDDAAHRLSRYYLVQLALNAGFGLVVAIGLFFIGVPTPAIWGILAAVLRFVPYVGSVIAAVFPLALAAAVQPGWTMVIETAAFFALAETVVGQMIEPLVYGHSTGLSPVAVVVSATFWTWLWGPIGLVLSTPLTVCLVVLGRHVERLRFLEIMFGDAPALSPPEIFFQRMLAGDPAEAADHAEHFLKKRPLLAYYESVALAGLKLAQADLSNGLLDREQLTSVRDSTADVVADLAGASDAAVDVKSRELDAETEAAIEASSENLTPPPVLAEGEIKPEWRAPGAVVCIGGHSELDEAAATILAQLLDKHGLPAETLGPDALRTADLFRRDLSAAQFLCLCFLDASNVAHIRYGARKLRRKAPNATLAVVLLADDAQGDEPMRSAADCDIVVRNLHDAIEAAIASARADGEPAQPAELPAAAQAAS
jgi:predicted PurR-regulated permease PerM